MSHDALHIMLPLLILQNEKDDFVQNQRQEQHDGEKLTIVRKNYLTKNPAKKKRDFFVGNFH